MNDVDYIFKLGSFVTDKVTGFSGIIDARTIWTNGSIQYSVHPGVKSDGTIGSSMWTDESMLVEDSTKRVECDSPQPLHAFSIGDKVKCRRTGLVGFVDGTAQWINGCLKYYIAMVKPGADGAPFGQWFDPETLKLIKSAERPVAVVRTGGPSSRSCFQNTKTA